jgi:lysophospholipase L1-like esterase
MVWWDGVNCGADNSMRIAILVTCLLGVVVAACYLYRRTTNGERETVTAGGARMLALGDSYTIGEGVAETERWPVLLAERLRAEGIGVAAPRIIARTGWTTDELQAAIDRSKFAGPFDLVTLLIGVNDQFRGRSVDTYRGEFRKLLQRAVEFAGRSPGKVIVLSIPDWGVTPFAAERDGAAVGAEIDRFNAVNRAETKQAGAHYIEITEISRQARGDRKLIAGDGLHPSAAMYRRWAELVLPVAKNILGQDGETKSP